MFQKTSLIEPYIHVTVMYAFRALCTCNSIVPFLCALIYAQKLVLQTVGCGIVAWSAKVKIVTLGALPPNPGYVVTATTVTCDVGMMIA